MTILRNLAAVLNLIWVLILAFVVLAEPDKPPEALQVVVLSGLFVIPVVNIVVLEGGSDAANWLAMRMRRKALEEKLKIKQLQQETEGE